MLESRSCQCASLGEEWEGDNWLISLELARAVPFSLSPRSHFILSLSLEGQQWREGGRGSRRGEHVRHGHFPALGRRTDCPLVRDVSGSLSLPLQWLLIPSCYSCTPRHHASCIHAFKKLSPTEMDWSTDTHTHSKNFQKYFLPPHGGLWWPIKEKNFSTYNTYISEHFLTALWW